MEEAAGGRVLLALPGVAVPVSLPPRLLQGQLRLRQRAQDLELQWEPLEGNWEPPGEEAPPDPGFEPDWAVLTPPRPRPCAGWAGGFSLSLGELRGLRRGPPGLSPPFLVLLPRGGGPCPPPLHLPRGGLRKLRRALGARLRPSPRDPRLLLVVTPEDPPEPPPEPGLVTRLLQGPCAATLGGLGLGGLGRLLGGPRAGAGPEPEPEPEPEPPFELLRCVTLPPRPCPARGPPLARADWGRGLSPEVLRERIFRGGVSPELRAEVWPFLLGLRDPGDPGGTPQTPDPARARRDDYFRMKLQWRSLSPGQLRRNKTLRGYQEKLERDLAVCPPWVSRARLRELLLTHCVWHFDLGYVGGMSELLAPLAGLLPDEAEAFWAFCSIMDTAGPHFGPGRAGLRRSLRALRALLRLLRPRGRPALAPGWRGLCSRWLQLRFQPQLGLEGTRRLWEVLWTGLPCPNFLLLVTCALLELLGDSAGDSPGGTSGGTSGDTSGGTSGDTFGDSFGDSSGDSFGDIWWDSLGDSPGDSGSDGDTDSEDSEPGDTVSPAVSLEVGEVLSRAEGIYLQLAATKDLPPALQELLGLGGTPKSPEEPPGTS